MVSSIKTGYFVDKFPHVAGQIGAENHAFACCRVGETEFGGVERLALEAEPVENRAKRGRSPSVEWIPQ